MTHKIDFKKWKSLSKIQKEAILYRSKKNIDDFIKKVIPIVNEVKEHGDKALCRFTKKFEKAELTPSTLLVQQKEFEEAEASLSKKVKEALSVAMRNVYNYHTKYKQGEGNILSEVSRGVFAGQRSTPLDSVGLYVPQGKGRFPSMTYMLSIPAQIAKVPRRVLITPPYESGKVDAACLYVAKKTGVHEVYKVGGAQGIAALAYGTKRISPVAKIIGPGSSFVSAAKQYVKNIVDIGISAGPSESVIIADGTTPAYNVASDLCIEAEHGTDSMSLLLTHKKEFAQQVCEHLSQLIENAPPLPKDILLKVFNQYPPVIVTESEEKSLEVCNLIAPEHLMIHSQSPSFLISDIKNAGEILIGEHSVFSLANYAAGPNAILPTGGTAKSMSGVSVSDFVKHSTLIKISKEGQDALSPHVQTLAEYEGFYFHKKALENRVTKK